MTGHHRLADLAIEEWRGIEPADGQRIELIDGQLRIEDSPTAWQQKIAGRIGRALAEVAEPAGWDVLSAVPVRVSCGFGCVPDIVVCAPVRPSTLLISARAVVLVVEVEAKAGNEIDDVEKPASYAKAGIPAFWRAEIVKKRLAGLHCYRRTDEGVYVEHAVVVGGQPQTILLPIGAEVTLDVDALER